MIGKSALIIGFLSISSIAFAQHDDSPKAPSGGPCGHDWRGAGPVNGNTQLLVTMKNFHDQLVEKEIWCIQRSVHDSLTYGHSNGWMESKTQLTQNLTNGYMIYHSFKEDSIVIVRDSNTAHIRFIATIEATLNGKPGTFRLKVLEVWVKKNDEWLLFARQAVKG